MNSPLKQMLNAKIHQILLHFVAGLYPGSKRATRMVSWASQVSCGRPVSPSRRTRFSFGPSSYRETQAQLFCDLGAGTGDLDWGGDSQWAWRIVSGLLPHSELYRHCHRGTGMTLCLTGSSPQPVIQALVPPSTFKGPRLREGQPLTQCCSLELDHPSCVAGLVLSLVFLGRGGRKLGPWDRSIPLERTLEPWLLPVPLCCGCYEANSSLYHVMPHRRSQSNRTMNHELKLLKS